ncbi:hypothetical protein AcdelDRAFT_0020 [Acidovorax delafieldii 2AN]|uniref:Uncharacterized protein n=1 Tax=Acidovorax delafieldii 2AN TaxID=573060 RepID=C5SZE0_ACIDE|nr:hypothetical protein [Acidovorax delafieldii]EER62336.1 hypothetical protein AcdelDRAFT_0020 [Acidovorax delafieldii 2AN]
MTSATPSLQLRRIFRDSLRLYFAPLAGAYKGIKVELRRVDLEIARGRDAQIQQSKTPPRA